MDKMRELFHTEKFLEEDKLVTEKEAVKKFIKDGQILGIGGGLNYKQSLGLIREIIRQQIKNIHLTGTARSIDCDMLIGNDCVSTAETTFLSFEHWGGVSPMYRYYSQEGKVDLRESCCIVEMLGLRASEMGVPFLPTTGAIMTDMAKYHPEWKTIKDPYTNKLMLAVPAIQPDIALVHVQEADIYGNARVEKPYVTDMLMVKSCKTLVLSAEKIVEKVKRPNIPYFYTGAVVHLPFGAHPTFCDPYYTWDKDHLLEYAKTGNARRTGDRTLWDEYMEKYVFGCKDHFDYYKDLLPASWRR